MNIEEIDANTAATSVRNLKAKFCENYGAPDKIGEQLRRSAILRNRRYRSCDFFNRSSWAHSKVTVWSFGDWIREATCSNNFLSVGYTRSRIPPWGVEGGNDGTPNFVEVLRSGKTTERYAFGTNIAVNTDDVIRIVTGVGGGYGDPGRRSREAVLNDLKDGYVTLERAEEVYGLKV